MRGISVSVYRPAVDHVFEVSNFRAGGGPACPLPENVDDLFPMIGAWAESLADLRLPDGIDKPVLIGEWHFGALDRGKFHASLRPVASQQARGEACEEYVASALENPWVVGTHGHQFGDQATTGRDDGENFQHGFVDVCDTPYTETVAACRRIGYRLYETRTGQPG